MRLSKSNQAKYADWDFQSPKKIADKPLYMGYPITKNNVCKVIVLQFPNNPNTSDFKTPVVFETAEHPSIKAAMDEAVRECT